MGIFRLLQHPLGFYTFGLKNYLSYFMTWWQIVLLKLHEGTYPFKTAKLSKVNFITYEFNPIPTGTWRNQPIFEYCVTTAGRNRVNGVAK